MQYRQTVHLRVPEWSDLAAVSGSNSFARQVQTWRAHGLKASPLTTIQSF
ncbi:MAG: hypothetical protein ACI9GK_001580 [Devosia sp.]|jgi:hypothetical protein